MRNLRFILWMCLSVIALSVSGRSFDEVHVNGSCSLRIIFNPDSVGELVRDRVSGSSEISFSYGGSSLFISAPSVPGHDNLPELTLYSDSSLRVIEVSGRASVHVVALSSTSPVALVAAGAASLSVDEISAPNVNISLSGSGKINVSGQLTATTLNFSVTGSGRVQADAVTVSRMSVTQRGSGKLLFSGSARDCSVVERGTGTIDLRKLVADKFDLKLFGDGWIFYPAGVPVKIGGNSERIMQVKPYQPL